MMAYGSRTMCSGLKRVLMLRAGAGLENVDGKKWHCGSTGQTPPLPRRAA